MAYYNLRIFSSVISITCIYNYGLAYSMEGIIGAKIAQQNDYKYQVAIIGRQNYSRTYFLICGGGIIAKQFILSAAQCFLDASYNLKNISFSIAAGTSDLKSSAGVKIGIDIIYFPGDISTLYVNDIAVSKLKESFNFKDNENVSKLELSHYRRSFVGIANVAGFGYYEVKIRVNSTTGLKKRVSGHTNGVLRHAEVFTIEYNVCKLYFTNINPDKQTCGFIVPAGSEKYAGICTNDAGTPLVVENEVIALASRNYAECNDTEYGCLYTNVWPFLWFIKSILEGFIPQNSSIFKNLPHIM